MASNATEIQFPFPKLVRRFIEQESSAGIVMIFTTVLALILANGMFYGDYKAFINTSISFGLGDLSAVEPLKVWVKDLLMVLFFLLVGLELKREFKEGFLSSSDQVLLPAVAALAGMVVPALIYVAFHINQPELMSGWAVSSATDIAFALAVLLLAGRHAPPSVKIFLLAIAIFDDLGAILIIAFFYTGAINFVALGFVAAGIIALIALNRRAVPLVMPYIIVAIYLWFALYHSGIHTTLAGVLAGLAMPMRAGANKEASPVNQCIHFLHPWVGFIILPLFAFVSAGVHLRTLSFDMVLQPLPLSIALALFLGKQIGIFLATYATVRLGAARLPEGANWRHIYGVSVLAGIGFTMSLFIGYLAFDSAQMDAVKLGVLTGSLLSSLFGAVVFACIRPRAEKLHA